jgi:predicted restriction endonuclease
MELQMALHNTNSTSNSSTRSVLTADIGGTVSLVRSVIQYPILRIWHLFNNEKLQYERLNYPTLLVKSSQQWKLNNKYIPLPTSTNALFDFDNSFTCL